MENKGELVIIRDMNARVRVREVKNVSSKFGFPCMEDNVRKLIDLYMEKIIN